jgi:hypothetical protein
MLAHSSLATRVGTRGTTRTGTGLCTLFSGKPRRCMRSLAISSSLLCKRLVTRGMRRDTTCEITVLGTLQLTPFFAHWPFWKNKKGKWFDLYKKWIIRQDSSDSGGKSIGPRHHWSQKIFWVPKKYFPKKENQTILCRSRAEREFLKIWSLYSFALSFQQRRAFIQEILFSFFKWGTLAQKKGHFFHF